MAEAILRSKQLNNIEVCSAGVQAVDGIPISAYAEQLIKMNEMPYTTKSNAVTEQMIEDSDVILTMTEAHKSILHHILPQSTGKVYTLKEYVGHVGNIDVLDPFGGTLAVYQETFNELSLLIEQLEEKISGR